ncbi:RNA 2',3'-cyclic phosphodiesterase [Isoptericola jiangsuensis]|uniref:RNA 2',3'-cyclic phosphodiesterase n=1 Tax=Isoptericola jiangsuensis TaxID=548579 RepID=UPI003AAC7AA4
MRLFTAVYPSTEALAHLDLALSGVGADVLGPGLRRVPPSQRHVTLVFHGEVSDGAVDDYVEDLTSALQDVGPFDLEAAGCGSFGGRTLWIGLGGGVDRLRELSHRVARTAEDAGVAGAERSGGRPHLTVARASSSLVGADRARARRARRRGEADQEGPASPFGAWARALSVYRGPAFTVTEVRVVASRLGAGPAGGPAHDEVAVVPLGGLR